MAQNGLPQLEMKKVIPAAIIGVIGLGFAAAVVGNWLMDMMDSSYRMEGRYAKQLEVAAPPAVIPKTTYLCQQGEKNPWLGCSIR